MNEAQAEREALWYEKRPDGRMACLLCPHACLVTETHPGKCGVRLSRDGRLVLPFYGRISSLAVDPIEKKPLYHFHPGSRILSAGFVGCSFHCKFCQNWVISQTTDAGTRYMSPASLVEEARRQGSFGIAYTYSEPLVHAEYVMDTARLAHAAGLKNVLVSNGFLNPGPADEILGLMDAANIDLKGFDEQFYRTETGGSLSAVQRFLMQAAGARAPRGHHARDSRARTMTRRRSRALPALSRPLGRTYPCTFPPTTPITSTAFLPPRRLRSVTWRGSRGGTCTMSMSATSGRRRAILCALSCGSCSCGVRGYKVSVEGVTGGRVLAVRGRGPDCWSLKTGRRAAPSQLTRT